MKVWHNQNRLPFDIGPNNAQGDNSCHPMPRKLAGELEKNGIVAPLLWEQTYPRHEIRGSVLAPVSGAHPVVVNSHRCSSLNSHKLERAHSSEAAGPLQAQHRSLNMVRMISCVGSMLSVPNIGLRHHHRLSFQRCSHFQFANTRVSAYTVPSSLLLSPSDVSNLELCE